MKKLSINACILFFGVCVLLSCKKDDEVDIVDSQKQQVTMNMDSIYQYAQAIYLWNDQLPSQGKFQSESFYQSSESPLGNYRNLISELVKSAINPETNVPFEFNAADPTRPKFSTLLERQAINIPNENSSFLTLEADVFGLSVFNRQDSLTVVMVDRNSPAGRAGIVRGDRIIAVNDEPITAVNSANLWATLEEQSFVKLSIVTGTGAVRHIRLTDSFYETNPLLKSAIIKSNDREIGFMAYRSFTEETNSAKYLDPVFYTFEQEDISDIVIDLRYNGGGFQHTVAYIADRLCPRESDGKLMYTEHYNKTMQEGQATILQHQIIKGNNNEPVYINGRVATLFDIDYSVEANTAYFHKTGALNNLKKVYFIVSKHTASASELLINVLKPYMNVEIIGVSEDGSSTVHTYGKPVGFFDISLSRYALFLSMYYQLNAKGEGKFFDGIPATYSTIDDVRYDFGDGNDPAIAYITSGSRSPSLSLQANGRSSANRIRGNYLLAKPR